MDCQKIIILPGINDLSAGYEDPYLPAPQVRECWVADAQDNILIVILNEVKDLLPEWIA